jgi:hypothetical protein
MERGEGTNVQKKKGVPAFTAKMMETGIRGTAVALTRTCQQSHIRKWTQLAVTKEKRVEIAALNP